MTNNSWVAGNKKLSHKGMAARKSTTPQKLKIYLRDRGLMYMRKKYSRVNSVVKNHSTPLKKFQTGREEQIHFPIKL